jgi:hypothetical protein
VDGFDADDDDKPVATPKVKSAPSFVCWGEGRDQNQFNLSGNSAWISKY